MNISISWVFDEILVDRGNSEYAVPCHFPDYEFITHFGGKITAQNSALLKSDWRII